jgi:hypothetical protein
MSTYLLRNGACLLVVASVLAAAASAPAASFDFDAPVTLGSGGWSVDRTAPGVFQTTVDPNDPTNNVLQHGVRGTPTGSGFSDFQGVKYAVNQTGGVQVFSIDLYVGADWASSNRSVQMWLGTQLDGVEYGYPGLAYRSNPAANVAAGFYFYDPFANDYLFVGSGVVGWNTLQVVFTVGTVLEYLVNGLVVVEEFDNAPNGVGSLYLQAYNFGTEYDAYWDNLRIEQRDPAVVPVPLAAPAGLAMLGVFAIRRRAASRG